MVWTPTERSSAKDDCDRRLVLISERGILTTRSAFSDELGVFGEKNIKFIFAYEVWIQ